MSYHTSPGPHATFSSSQTQTVLNAANAQAITYDTTLEATGIYLVDTTKITLPQTGHYCLTFSAIGHNSASSSPKWMNIFVKKNGSPMSNSSTIVSNTKDIPTTIVATFDLPCTAVGDYYEFWMAGQDTGTQILATAANPGGGGVPAMPACPSIIVAAWQIS